MAAPKYAERVAVLEVKFDDLKETVEEGFKTLGQKIDNAQLNGQTDRVKNMSKELGDPGDVQILASMVESHKRRVWLMGPLGYARGYVANAALWITTGIAIGAVHAWLHAAFPVIP